MKTIYSIIIIVFIGWGFWFVGGIHLDYVGENAKSRIVEMGFEVDKCSREGYLRSMFNGFGGKVYFLCERNNILYEFNLARRINNAELQFYGLKQKTSFPTQFKLN